MSSGVRISIGGGLTLTALLCASRALAQPAAEPTREACFASHGNSQELRIDGKLMDARKELRLCSAPACPSMVRNDCASWLAEVEQQIPSVTVLADIEGGAATQVRTLVDGRVLSETVDGSVHELDPGAHTFRFETEGYPAEEQTLVLRQYEKRRVLRADFRKPVPAAPTPVGAAPAPTPAAPPPPAVPTSRPVPIPTWIFGGLAVAAAGASAYLGVSALRTNSDKRDSCSPNCSDSDVRQLKSTLLLADITGGVALVSAGIATYLYFTRPEVAERPPTGLSNRVRVAVTPNGAGLVVRSAF